MLRVLDWSSISYMPVRVGKPFGKHTMSVRFYKRMGAMGWQTWYMNLFAKSPKTLEQFARKLEPRQPMPKLARGITADNPVRG